MEPDCTGSGGSSPPRHARPRPAILPFDTYQRYRLVSEEMQSTLLEFLVEREANELLRRELNARLRNLGRAPAPRKKRF